MTGIIYKITNPKGKIYIGQTIDVKTRFYNYEIKNCKKKGFE
jgi:predicted GIY-YIG superfamily endonuclease